MYNLVKSLFLVYNKTICLLLREPHNSYSHFIISKHIYDYDKDGKYEVRNETRDEQEYKDGASGYHFEIYDTSDDSGKKYGDFYVDKDTGKIYKRNTKTEKLEEYKK